MDLDCHHIPFSALSAAGELGRNPETGSAPGVVPPECWQGGRARCSIRAVEPRPICHSTRAPVARRPALCSRRGWVGLFSLWAPLPLRPSLLFHTRPSFERAEDP